MRYIFFIWKKFLNCHWCFMCISPFQIMIYQKPPKLQKLFFSHLFEPKSWLNFSIPNHRIRVICPKPANEEGAEVTDPRSLKAGRCIASAINWDTRILVWIDPQTIWTVEATTQPGGFCKGLLAGCIPFSGPDHPQSVLGPIYSSIMIEVHTNSRRSMTSQNNHICHLLY